MNLHDTKLGKDVLIGFILVIMGMVLGGSLRDSIAPQSVYIYFLSVAVCLIPAIVFGIYRGAFSKAHWKLLAYVGIAGLLFGLYVAVIKLLPQYFRHSFFLSIDNPWFLFAVFFVVCKSSKWMTDIVFPVGTVEAQGLVAAQGPVDEPSDPE